MPSTGGITWDILSVASTDAGVDAASRRNHLDITWDSLLVASSSTWPPAVAIAVSMAPADAALPIVIAAPTISVHLDSVEMAVAANTGEYADADVATDANAITGAASGCCADDNAYAAIATAIAANAAETGCTRVAKKGRGVTLRFCAITLSL